MANISALVPSCLNGFRSLNDSLPALLPESGLVDSSVTEGLRPSIKNELGRFRVWVTNLGAHRMGKSSLDYRLRDASNIRTQVINLLDDLLGCLQDATSIANGTVEPWDSIDPTSEDEDSDSDGPEAQAPSGLTELSQIVSEASEIINCLFRLSVSIHNPAPHDRFRRSAMTDTSYYEEFDTAHVRNKFPSADQGIVKQLGKANSFRRQYFRYREEHHRKLAQGLPDEDMERPGCDDTKTIGDTTVASSLPQHLKASNSDGSGFEDFDSRSEAGRTETSFAPSSAPDGSRSRVPSMPDDAEKGPFECPFCYRMISVETTKEWRKHVLGDLRPYICLYPDCSAAGQDFQRRHQWIQHVQQAHWKIFLCPLACKDLQIEDIPALEAHLATFHKEHAETLSPESLIQLSEQERPLDASKKCELCDEELDSFKAYSRHVGRHQEDLALFVLPDRGLDANMDDEEAFVEYTNPYDLARWDLDHPLRSRQQSTVLFTRSAGSVSSDQGSLSDDQNEEFFKAPELNETYDGQEFGEIAISSPPLYWESRGTRGGAASSSPPLYWQSRETRDETRRVTPTGGSRSRASLVGVRFADEVETKIKQQNAEILRRFNKPSTEQGTNQDHGLDQDSSSDDLNGESSKAPGLDHDNQQDGLGYDDRSHTSLTDKQQRQSDEPDFVSKGSPPRLHRSRTLWDILDPSGPPRPMTRDRPVPNPNYVENDEPFYVPEGQEVGYRPKPTARHVEDSSYTEPELVPAPPSPQTPTRPTFEGQLEQLRLQQLEQAQHQGKLAQQGHSHNPGAISTDVPGLGAMSPQPPAYLLSPARLNKAENKARESTEKAKGAEEEEKAAEEALKKKILAKEAARKKNEGEVEEKIRFKDAVGRIFSFPFRLCQTWQGMEELIKQAFIDVDVIGPHVLERHYDLIGPDGEVILPSVWERVIEPGWQITMRMWPMDLAPTKPLSGTKRAPDFISAPPPAPAVRHPIYEPSSSNEHESFDISPSFVPGDPDNSDSWFSLFPDTNPPPQDQTQGQTQQQTQPQPVIPPFKRGDDKIPEAGDGSTQDGQRGNANHESTSAKDSWLDGFYAQDGQRGTANHESTSAKDSWLDGLYAQDGQGGTAHHESKARKRASEGDRGDDLDTGGKSESDHGHDPGSRGTAAAAATARAQQQEPQHQQRQEEGERTKHNETSDDDERFCLKCVGWKAPPMGDDITESEEWYYCEACKRRLSASGRHKQEARPAGSGDLHGTRVSEPSSSMAHHDDHSNYNHGPSKWVNEDGSVTYRRPSVVVRQNLAAPGENNTRRRSPHEGYPSPAPKRGPAIPYKVHPKGGHGYEVISDADSERRRRRALRSQDQAQAEQQTQPQPVIPPTKRRQSS